MLTRDDLHPYQRRTVEFIKATPRCALWLDMGLGKTTSTLTAVRDMLDQFEIGRVLVIAPKRVAVDTWPRELEKWAHLGGIRLAVIDGGPEKRTATLRDSDADVFTIGRELVPWLVDVIRNDDAIRARFRQRWPFDVVVIDEASSFKNRSAQRFKALRKVRGHIDRVIELTGTPAGNGLLDLWPQIFLIDGGERLGKTFTKYRDTYFDGDYMGFKYTPKPGADEAIHARLADVVLRLDSADYLQLPPFLPCTIEVELPAAARQHYRELEREYITQIEGADVTVAQAAALSNKLLQCANGAVYTNEARDVAHLHAAKLDALDGIVAEHPGRPVLVAYSYRTDVPRLLERFPAAVLLDDKPETIARWNRGEIEMLLTHPASAGHGLNLQDGGNIVVWFGVTWSLELYQQFNARLRRQGQQAAVVHLYHITAADTVDGTVLASLERKNTTQGALLDALKTDIRERLAA